MINQVHIQNYKCLRDVTVDLKPLTVLIGPNDSGKTSILEALRLTSQAVSLNGEELQSRREMGSLTHKLNGQVIQIKISTSCPKELKYQLNVDAICEVVEDSLELDGKRLYSQWVDNPEYNKVWFELGVGVGEFEKGPVSKNQDGAKPGWRFFRDEIRGGPLANAVEVFRCSSIYRLQPELLRSRVPPTSAPVLASDGSNLADVLHFAFNGPDRTVRGKLEERLHAAVPALLGIFTPVIEFAGQQVLQIEYVLDVQDKSAKNSEDSKRKAETHIPCNQVSDGALLLTAFLALGYAETPDILLIEEPENGLHPGRLEMVIDLLRKMTTGEVGNKPRQVILTTHSPLLLNYVDPSEVRVFRRNENGETTITPMNEVPEIDRLMKTFSPGEIWNLFGEEKMFEGVPV